MTSFLNGTISPEIVTVINLGMEISTMKVSDDNET